MTFKLSDKAVPVTDLWPGEWFTTGDGAYILAAPGLAGGAVYALMYFGGKLLPQYLPPDTRVDRLPDVRVDVTVGGGM